jgi:hypothetical protein
LPHLIFIVISSAGASTTATHEIGLAQVVGKQLLNYRQKAASSVRHRTEMNQDFAYPHTVWMFLM